MADEIETNVAMSHTCPLDQQMEEVLIEWIYNRWEKDWVSRKLIMKETFHLQWEDKREWLWTFKYRVVTKVYA